MTLQKRDFAFEIKEITESGVFTGYGSVFGVVDSYGEIVAPGAFSQSLSDHKAKGTMPSMLWQHRSAEPMGVYTEIIEDNIGLKVTGQIAMKTQRGAEAYELMKLRAITGLSIGFMPREDTRDKVSGITTLNVVDLWEVSPVTFPANDSARIQGVKSIELISDLRSAERFLRDSGMSRNESVAFISRVKSLAQSDSDEDGLQLIKDALEHRNYKPN